MMRLTCVLLGAALAVSGCVAEPGPMAPQAGANSGFAPSPGQQATPPAAEGAARVGLLVPLTGAYAGAGDALKKAAQLALSGPDAPALDVQDTTSTGAGAAAAARAALAAGDRLIIGPLTSTETAAVAPIARAAAVPVLAFTSDSSQAQPGIWVLGLTPTQQVDRLMRQAAEAGKSNIAALLPENELGQDMGAALAAAASRDGLPPPRVRTYGAGMQAITQAVQAISDYATRRGPIDQQIEQAKRTDDRAALKAAIAASHQPLPPLSYNALLLADTGTPLAELATLLPYYDVSGVQIMGPALWAAPANRNGAGALLAGAWYAGFDPAARGPFVTAYTARFGTAPPLIADFAFDAASIAHVTLDDTTESLTASLTRPGGFTGANGAMLLLPDGRTRRALGVFQIDQGNTTMIAPPPPSLTPSS